MKEYRQREVVRLRMRARDENGVSDATAWAALSGGEEDNPRHEITLSGWAMREDDGDRPVEAEMELSGDVEQQPPGLYEISVMVIANDYNALTRHELDPPLRFRIVEHPDDVREGPEVLSVGEPH